MNTYFAASLAKRRALIANKEKGFTLVELLVVVLIIGILAAVAIPLFLAQRQGAWEAQVKSDIANSMIAAETYAVGHNGSYASLTLALLKTNGYNPTKGVTIKPVPSTLVGAVAGTSLEVPAGASYTLEATHDDYTSFKWTYDSVTGLTAKAAK